MTEPSLIPIDVTLSVPPPKPLPEAEPLIGAVLGGFRLTQRLGSGGMGAVYLGEHTVIGSKVAVKVLHAELASNAALVERFHAEARAVNLIDHENIVRIFDLAKDPEGRHYLVMEYLDGEPLTRLCGRPVPPEVAIPLLQQVLAALGAAHARFVVHRDLKPDNIFLIRREGKRFVKVLDFGVAKLLAGAGGAAGEQTLFGQAIGTPTYMAPEQWLGKNVDARSDLYAVGVLSYLLATGQLPFPRGSMLELLAYHREQIPASAKSVNPELPVAWSDAIARALEKRPEDRFQTAEEMSAAFGKALQAASPASSSRRVAFVGADTPPPIAPVTLGEVAARATPTPGRPKVTPVPDAGRRDTRFGVQLAARVLTPSGKELFRALVTELSRGGLYVCQDGVPPPLFTRLDVELTHGARTLVCRGEVVRHVSAEDAAKWHMSPGFAVQFVDAHELRPQISELIRAIVPAQPGLELAAKLAKVASADFYAVLSIAPDASMEQLRARAQELRQDLSVAEGDLTVDDAQRAQVREARQKVDVARAMLVDPRSRAEHDLGRRNFRGIAHCVDAGLSAEELEKLHAQFSDRHPDDVNGAKLHFISGGVWEKRGDLEQASSQYEAALRLDPANPAAHAALRGLECLRADQRRTA